MMVKTLFAGVCLLGLGDGAFFTQKAVASQQSPQGLTAEVCRILRCEYSPARHGRTIPDFRDDRQDPCCRVYNLFRAGAQFNQDVVDAFDVAFGKLKCYCNRSLALASDDNMRKGFGFVADNLGGLVAVINRIRWDAAEESVRLAAQAMLEGKVRNQWYPEMRHIMEKYQ